LRTLPPIFTRVPLDGGATLHPHVLGFAVLVTVAVAIATGLAPVLLASPKNPIRDIQAVKPRWTAWGLRLTARQVFLVLQVALAVVLTVTAGLYAHSLQQIAAVDPGYI